MLELRSFSQKTEDTWNGCAAPKNYSHSEKETSGSQVLSYVRNGSVVDCPNYCSFSATGNSNLSLSPSPPLSIGKRQVLRSRAFGLRLLDCRLGLRTSVRLYSAQPALLLVTEAREEREEEEEAAKTLKEIRVNFSAMKLLSSNRPDFGPDDAHWPALPEIKDKAIERQIFTHRSFHARPTNVFEDHPDDLSPDNERYEHLGDTVLGLVVTNLMFDMFPGLRVGPSTKIRSLVVGNLTLADISKRYKLPERLWLHPAQAVTLRASTNIQADLFEAFVGGLFRDQGLYAVQQWLVPLFRPFAQVGYDYVRKQHTLPPLPLSPSSLLNGSANHTNGTANGNGEHDDASEYFGGPTKGHLALFNQQLQRANRQVEWIYSDGSDPSMNGLEDGGKTFFENQISAPLLSSTSTGMVCADPSSDGSDGEQNGQTTHFYRSAPGSTSTGTTSVNGTRSLPNSPEARGNGSSGRRANGWYSDPHVPAHLRIKGTTLTPVWYVKVLVDGEFYGRGRGNTKKAARNEAAKEGLIKLGIEV